jgi:hypothetical protein
VTEVSFDGRGFSVRNKRVHVVGGRFEYSLVDRASWPARLQAMHAAGFNTVVSSVPWALHERRQGHHEFEGEDDIAAFLEAASNAGLWVILRIGPNVGSPFGGGGLPSWLADLKDKEGHHLLLREASPGFLEAVTHWWSALCNQIESSQPQELGEGPSSGPLLAVQIEHEWSCGNEEGARAYFGELIHLIRELGISVPLLTTNGFWQEVEGTVETWVDRVDEPDLFANTRQLHAVQPEAPRIVNLVGGSANPELLGKAMLEVLAAGGMPIVDDAVSGVHRRTLPASGKGSSIFPGSILDLHGNRVAESLDAMCTARFARSFGSLLADLDPALDTPVTRPGSRPCSTVARSGPSGSMIFQLRGPGSPDSTDRHIVLRDGRSLETTLMDTGSWCLADVNLGGMGQLDHSNVPLLDLVNRRILVAYGAAGSVARFGIDGSELELTVPEAKATMPEVVEFKNFTIVLCTPEQARGVVDDGSAIYLGADGIDEEGRPTADPAGKGLIRIDVEGEVEQSAKPARTRKTSTKSRLDWSTSLLREDIDGSSDRFATLNGPTSLVECGIRRGYGWYRVRFKAGSAAKRTLHFPEGPHRLVVFLNGKQLVELSASDDSQFRTEAKFKSGENVMTVLSELVGGSESGNHQVHRCGLYEPVESLTPFKGVKTSVDKNAPPIDLFESRSFIPEVSSGDKSSIVSYSWSFSHRRKSGLRVAHGMRIRGTWLLNDVVLGRSEEHGLQSFKLEPSITEAMKSGKNELVFRPDPNWEEAASGIRQRLKILEVTDEFGSDEGSMAFSTCSIPDGLVHEFTPLAKSGRSTGKTGPTWSRASVEVSSEAGQKSLDLSGMSRGVVFFDGSELGTYDACDMPSIPIPMGVLDGEGIIDVFDEQGADPRVIVIA